MKIEESIELAVPVHRAYDQWTHFADFPRFVPSLERVERLDERRVRFHARLGAAGQDWETEIYEQVPDERIAWKSVTGDWGAGVVTFQPVGNHHSRIVVRADFDPTTELAIDSFAETVGRHRVVHALERFKDLVEGLGRNTTGWRNPIPDDDEEVGELDEESAA